MLIYFKLIFEQIYKKPLLKVFLIIFAIFFLQSQFLFCKDDLNNLFKNRDYLNSKLNVNNFIFEQNSNPKNLTSEQIQDLITQNIFFLEIGGNLILVDDYKADLTNMYLLNLFYGKKIYKRTYLNFGFGFNYFKVDRNLTMPLMIGINTIPNNTDVSPYFGLKGGYNFDLKNSFSPLGEYFNSQVGLGFKQKEQLSNGLEFSYYLIGGISYGTMMINGQNIETIGLFLGFIP